MNLFVRRLIVGSVFVLYAGSAWSHHSFSATFKEGAPIDVEGEVTRFSFKNPHVMVHIDVTDASGNVTNWAAEGPAATLMRRMGWSRNSIKKGDYVKITGDSTHDGSPMVSVEKAVKLDADSKEVIEELSMERGNRASPSKKLITAPLLLDSGRPNVSGDWAGEVKGAPPGPPPIPVVPFNEEGAALQARHQISTDAQVFCDAPGLVRQAGFTPHPFRITQHDDYVQFEYEEYGSIRKVYFDSARPISGVKTHLGDSVARYEGSKLIVESKNLLSNLISPDGQRLSEQATTVEIYERADDDDNGAVLAVEMIVTDPKYLTEPLSLTKLKTLVENYVLLDNECRQPLRQREVVFADMGFFFTSKGLGDGANLSDLAGADAHCEALADSVGAGGKGWAAYLGGNGEVSVNARDRIGNGPWYNAKGVPIALNVADLHSDTNNLSKTTVVDERGQLLTARGDEPSLQEAGDDGLFYCFANKTNPALMGSPLDFVESDPVQKPLPEAAVSSHSEADSQAGSSKNWLIGLLLILGVAGLFVLLRRKKA